jgi:hypothetical protein
MYIVGSNAKDLGKGVQSSKDLIPSHEALQWPASAKRLLGAATFRCGENKA